METNMVKPSLCDKIRSALGHKPAVFGPPHPDSYRVFITHDLVSAAMNVIVDKSTPWPKDSEYRIEMAFVNVPLEFCPPHVVHCMPPAQPGKHPYAVLIAKVRFRRTPEHPGGELTAIATTEWKEMAVAFGLEPRDFVSVVPLSDRTHQNEGTH
ncbi:uncharacterized protein FTOL_08774 [Fusarium torulosum]|uniref:Uncharacterized protein n=1 Tax=Fusarium torulosum TaxID=33205 RepID=A0AAE8MEP3_9HYPO|nr:uncharacterized protein FTOL_08774 [Fusarium torulosum]